MAIKEGIVGRHFEHIDSGGVEVKITDKGDEGLFLSIAAEYYGYPGVRAEINIRHLSESWLKEVGLMFLQVHSKGA